MRLLFLSMVSMDQRSEHRTISVIPRSSRSLLSSLLTSWILTSVTLITLFPTCRRFTVQSVFLCNILSKQVLVLIVWLMFCWWRNTAGSQKVANLSLRIFLLTRCQRRWNYIKHSLRLLPRMMRAWWRSSLKRKHWQKMSCVQVSVRVL